MLVIILYTLLYIEKEQKQTEKEGQRRDGLPSCPPRPLPLLQVVRTGKSKAADETGREREPGRRMPPPSSPVPRLSSVLSAVLTVHTIASRSPSPRRTSNQGEGRAATSSSSGRSHRHTSPPIDQQAAKSSKKRLDGLPSSPPRPLPRLSSPLPGGEGMAESQPGREIPPAHPVDPLHPAGVPSA